MGKMDALLARANAAIPSASPWEDEEERPPEAGEPPAAPGTTPLDAAMEAASRAERQATLPEIAEMPTPPPEPPAPVTSARPLKVVEPLPVLKAVERLHQGVREDLRAVATVAKRQEDYLREVQRAHNAMTTSWYEIAEGLPTVRAELDRLRREIVARQTEVTAVREQAEEETRVALTMQARELEAVVRRVRRAATRAVLLVALVGLLAVIAVAVIAMGALQGLHLHRPL